jgi:hypothetical protein
MHGVGGPLFVGLSWVWFCVAPLLGFFLLLFVLIPLGIFVAAWFERVHLRQLRPAERAKAEAVERQQQPTVAEAKATAYEPLGVFSDGDHGFKEGLLTLMLSPDRVALLWVLHGKLAGRRRLITRSSDGHWLVTSNVTGVKDLSGLVDEKGLDVPLPVLEAYHRERLAAWDHPVNPWVVSTVAADVLAFERERVHRMTAAGYARYVMPGHTYTYRPAGAARLTLAYLGDMLALPAESQSAEARVTEYNLRRDAPDPLAEVAANPSWRPEFIRLLAERGVYLVLRRRHDPAHPTSLADPNDDAGVDHLDYVKEGEPVYPLFSSESRAYEYIRHLPPAEAVHRHVIQGVNADWLLAEETSRFALVLNPGSDAETRITPQDLLALRRARSGGASGAQPDEDPAG